jgi:hypothetical protein
MGRRRREKLRNANLRSGGLFECERTDQCILVSRHENANLHMGAYKGPFHMRQRSQAHDPLGTYTFLESHASTLWHLCAASVQISPCSKQHLVHHLGDPDLHLRLINHCTNTFDTAFTPLSYGNQNILVLVL